MIDKILQVALQHNASDIHITQDSVYFRINKDIIPYLYDDLKADKQTFIDSLKHELNEVLQLNLASQKQGSKTLQCNDIKCRISYFKVENTYNFALRILKTQIPTLQSLNLPKVLENLSLKESGLILVCGATGAGKSSSLAAMLHHINTHCKKHILTIEDPIEYEHAPIQSLITQREILRDSESFDIALEASLRQDPDVILIGEILDSKILKLAINHALSGHLVLSSFHAYNCSHAISRILAMSDSHSNLADCLQGIITQKLYVENNVLQADFEILIATQPIRTLIKEDKIHQISSQISMGREFGMQHFKRPEL